MDTGTDGIPLATADGAALFEHIFKSRFKNLHGYAYAIVKDDVLAEEVVQQVFLKLWERKDHLRIGVSVDAYLYRAVHNEGLNMLRHEKVRKVHRDHVLKTSVQHEHHTDQTAIRELQMKIQDALDALPEQCRTVFHLSRNEELRYSEIAGRLGISVKTVEHQVGKALRVLRKRLAEFLPVILLLISN